MSKVILCYIFLQQITLYFRNEQKLKYLKYSDIFKMLR